MIQDIWVRVAKHMVEENRKNKIEEPVAYWQSDSYCAYLFWIRVLSPEHQRTAAGTGRTRVSIPETIEAKSVPG